MAGCNSCASEGTTDNERQNPRFREVQSHIAHCRSMENTGQLIMPPEAATAPPDIDPGVIASVGEGQAATASPDADPGVITSVGEEYATTTSSIEASSTVASRTEEQQTDADEGQCA